MRLLVASVLLCLPLSAALADDKEVSLFDGKSLSGWHVMNNGKFAAKDGMIQLRGGSGWLRSGKEYADFVLTLEVRWLKAKQDSGVFLRSGIEGKNWPDKKVEVLVENTERVAMLFGAKHKLDKAKAAKALKPVNEWNEYVIRCVGKECEVKLNGEVVCTSDDVKLEKGYLGIQGENGDLDFRNLRIQVVGKK
jgi:hypothetical protein